MRRPRAELQPLQQIINQELYQDDTQCPPPSPVCSPFAVDMWIPGRPKAKARASPGMNKSGIPYLRTKPEEREAVEGIRNIFLDTMDTLYPDRVQHLPLLKGLGTVKVTVWALMPAPQDWFPQQPHEGPPDYDNITKLIWDAVGGRANKKPPLAFKDDSMVQGVGEGFKCYWDHRHQDTPSYPPTPGTYVVLNYAPYPRNPAWLDHVCKGCGRSDFTSRGGIVTHTKKCLFVALARGLGGS
jgi:hypothetical protein